jgi:exodeoxyribonuclease VII small subunit
LFPQTTGAARKNMKKSKNIPIQKTFEELTYEEAYAELVNIVMALEEDESSLDQAMALFERGQGLARYCSNLLDQAELKITEVTNNGLTEYLPRE